MNNKIAFSILFGLIALIATPTVYANSVSVTTEIPALTILSGETIPILDTSANGNLTSLSVTANLPCDDNDVPLLKIVAGMLGDTINVVESSSDSVGDGIRGTCLYSDSITNVTASGLDGLDRVFLNHTGSNPVHIPQGTMVTVTGIFESLTTIIQETLVEISQPLGGTEQSLMGSDTLQQNFNGMKINSGSALAGKEITEFSGWMKKHTTGSPSGTVTIGVYDSSLTLKHSFGTFNANTLTSSFTKQTGSTGTYTLVAGDYIGFASDCCTASNIMRIDFNTSNPYDGTDTHQSYHLKDDGWYDNTANDMKFELLYIE